MPLVSVIMPAYNRERFIRAAVDSVLGQTFLDFELIAVDDGSTDRSVEILESYCDKIKFFRQSHGGAPRARNLGIENSSGEYVLFFDSDDVLATNALEILLDGFRRNPQADIALGRWNYIDGEGKETRKGFHSQAAKTAIGQDMLRALCCYEMIWPIHSALVRRRLLPEQPTFDESLSAGQDTDLWIWCGLKNARCCFVDSQVASYRLHGQASVSTNHTNALNGTKQILEKWGKSPELQARLGCYLGHFKARLLMRYANFCLRMEKQAEAMEYLREAIALHLASPRDETCDVLRCVQIAPFPGTSEFRRKLEKQSPGAIMRLYLTQVSSCIRQGQIAEALAKLGLCFRCLL
jgi:glycosyltransferase involved in cell wall biosynthesis